MSNLSRAVSRCCSPCVSVQKRHLETAPNGDLTLYGKKVRNAQPLLPTQLLDSVLNILCGMSYRKRGLLKYQLSKAKNTTIYTSPRQPSNKEMKRLTKNLQDYNALEDINLRSLERSKKSFTDEVKKEDFLMLRSLPLLYFMSERIFTELQAFKPDFQPFDMLDLGHNLGTSVWAAHGFYMDSIVDYIVHEHTKKEYNRTVQLLNNKYDPYIPNVLVKGRFSLTRLKSKSYDLVTAINYFPYLQSYQIKQALHVLWHMTNDFLVIADISNKYTASRLSEVRTEFVEMQKKCKDGYILAPCPHANKCPMVSSRDAHGCRFKMSNITKPSKLTAYTTEQKQLLSHLDVDYSYLILAKGTHYTERDYSRILAPIKHLKNENRCQVLTCNSDGRMYKSVVPSRSSNRLYRHLKFKKSGDLLDESWMTHYHVALPLPWSNTSVEEKVTTIRSRRRQRLHAKLRESGHVTTSSPDPELEESRDGEAMTSRGVESHALVEEAEEGVREEYVTTEDLDHWEVVHGEDDKF